MYGQTDDAGITSRYHLSKCTYKGKFIRQCIVYKKLGKRQQEPQPAAQSTWRHVAARQLEQGVKQADAQAAHHQDGQVYQGQAPEGVHQRVPAAFSAVQRLQRAIKSPELVRCAALDFCKRKACVAYA